MVDANKKKSKADSINQNSQLLREKIVASMVASFRIEGIIISTEKAAATLKKLEFSGRK